MSKEIREGIYRLLIEQDCENEFQRFDWERRMPARILDYLHSKGVVIKKDKELPKVGEDYPFERLDEQAKMLKWHKDSLESLIGEKG